MTGSARLPGDSTAPAPVTLDDVSNPSSARILRQDDPEHAELLAQGWTVTATSWGARLDLTAGSDLSVYDRAVSAARRAGYEVREVRARETSALVDLDALVAPDFPDTPASHHEPLPLNLAGRIARGQWRAFGAWWQGRIVAFTILYRFEGRWEVDRTAVEASHRRRGLASAVKSASILTTYAEGARRWGTGGAMANAGSLAVNRGLGFLLEPSWHTLLPPAETRGPPPGHHASTGPATQA